jgi:hypothetical protein
MKIFTRLTVVTIVFFGVLYLLFFFADFLGIATTNVLVLNTYVKGHIVYLFVLFMLFSCTITLKMIRQIFEIRKKLKHI